MIRDQKYYQKQSEAILNDSQRKALFKALFELYQNSMPIFFRSKDGELKVTYSIEVEQLADKIREQIRQRDSQILDFFK